ncbi:MAG TPA: GYD domain-containing protein [Actinomycetota bacterium]
MPKYLWEAKYTVAGSQGLIKDGGSSRISVVEKLVSNLGGSVESIYYAFGDADLYAIVDLPDHATAAAISLSVAAAGGVTVKTTVLLSPEDIDDAAHKTIEYRPPGD